MLLHNENDFVYHGRYDFNIKVVGLVKVDENKWEMVVLQNKREEVFESNLLLTSLTAPNISPYTILPDSHIQFISFQTICKVVLSSFPNWCISVFLVIYRDYYILATCNIFDKCYLPPMGIRFGHRWRWLWVPQLMRVAFGSIVHGVIWKILCSFKVFSDLRNTS